MPLTCIAIDDEPLALSLLEQYIKADARLQLMTTFNDAIAGLAHLKKNRVDLLFIDIQMPDITGLDVVRSLEAAPLVVFTTAYRNFAIDGFALDAVDYLLKPIAEERFARAATKAVELHRLRSGVSPEPPKPLFVRSEYHLVQIDIDTIEYIESVEDYIRIHLSAGRPVMTLMTMKAILEKLPAGVFQRIHRSYIVPVAKIRSVLNKKVRLGAVELPVGDSYSEAVRRWMSGK
jgi:two-component system LytT family response regulator